MSVEKIKGLFSQKVLRVFVIVLVIIAAAALPIEIINEIYNIIFYHKFDLSQLLNTAAFAATAATVYYLAEQISTSVKQEQINRKTEEKLEKTKRSSDFIKRSNDPVFFAIYDEVEDFFEEMNKAKILAILNRNNIKKFNNKKHMRVLLVLNFFEEMGLHYNSNTTDRLLLKKYFQTMSIAFYHSSIEYVIDVRKRHNNNYIFKQFTDMCGEWLKDPNFPNKN